MRFSVIKFLVPLAVLAVLVIAWMNQVSHTPGNISHIKSQTQAIELDPSRFLIKPFFVQPAQVAVALDGGEIPVPSGQVPSIVIGGNILRTVHLAWVHDWSNAETRNLFKTLQMLYASEEASALPALKVYLNPVYSDAKGEAVQRAMLQIYFRSDNRDLYQIVAKEIAAGALAADPEAIRSRVETLEPLLMDDWNSKLEWLEGDIAKTFSVAKAQQSRNAKILNPAFKTQLASMREVINPSADLIDLSEFVQKANTVQRTWLHSLSDQASKEK